MSDFGKSLGGLLLLVVVLLVLPVGIAIAMTWEPAQTNNLVTGALTICGGAVALVALGVGLAVGWNASRGRTSSNTQTPPTYTPTVQVQPRSDYDHWRAQRAMIEAQRAAIHLERERQALALPLPPQPTAVQNWPEEADWQWIDATVVGSETW